MGVTNNPRRSSLSLAARGHARETGAAAAASATTVARTLLTGEDGAPNPTVRVSRITRELVDEGEIGAGGSGSVRKAYDPNLRREVATKVLAPDLVRSPASLDRFVEEARMMARLDHPNIVPVHDLVVDDPASGYIVMKLVRGRTLEALVADHADPEAAAADFSGASRPSETFSISEKVRQPGPDSIHRLLQVFLKVCDAVAFAHSRHVIHCDLKPANIMVGEFGEVYLMDWGIAEDIVERVPAPLRSMRGTPAFMSPEQAAGNVSTVTERTDIFGLGSVLYFILTGRAPFDADTLPRSLALARAAHFPMVEEAALNPPPPGLVRIVRKAMAQDPADRYATVTELSEAVDAVLRSDWSLPTRVFPSGAVIVTEGEWADVAYIIVRGQCSVTKTVNGKRRNLRTLEPGAVFGEAGILSGDVRTATVRAIDQVTVKVVTRALFQDKLAGDTWFGKFVLTLADRFRELDQKLNRSRAKRGTAGHPKRRTKAHPKRRTKGRTNGK
ncbi:MAG: serine/threonine-protein kinase [Polyangia bacterium]